METYDQPITITGKRLATYLAQEFPGDEDWQAEVRSIEQEAMQLPIDRHYEDDADAYMVALGNATIQDEDDSWMDHPVFIGSCDCWACDANQLALGNADDAAFVGAWCEAPWCQYSNEPHDVTQCEMTFEHTAECETRERPDACLQCWQSVPAEFDPDTFTPDESSDWKSRF